MSDIITPQEYFEVAMLLGIVRHKIGSLGGRTKSMSNKARMLKAEKVVARLQEKALRRIV